MIFLLLRRVIVKITHNQHKANQHKTAHFRIIRRALVGRLWIERGANWTYIALVKNDLAFVRQSIIRTQKCNRMVCWFFGHFGFVEERDTEENENNTSPQAFRADTCFLSKM